MRRLEMVAAAGASAGVGKEYATPLYRLGGQRTAAGDKELPAAIRDAIEAEHGAEMELQQRRGMGAPLLVV